jgi:hypothetical protein
MNMLLPSSDTAAAPDKLWNDGGNWPVATCGPETVVGPFRSEADIQQLFVPTHQRPRLIRALVPAASY